MHSRLLRGGLAAITAATLIGGSLLLAPAANAASTKVDPSFKKITQSVQVAGHKDRVTFTALGATSKSLKLQKDAPVVRAAASYEVVVKSASKRVLLREVTTTWRALNLDFNLRLGGLKSDHALVKVAKSMLKKSEAAAKVKVKASYSQLTDELNAEVAAFGGMEETQRWLQGHGGYQGDPTIFDNFELTQQSGHVIGLTLTSNPETYAVSATLEGDQYRQDIYVTVHPDYSVEWSPSSLARRLGF